MTLSTPPVVPVPSSGSAGLPRLTDRGASRRDSVDAGRWSVRGNAKVTKDVRAGAVDARGWVSVGGAFSAGSLRGRGTIEVVGPIEVNGTASFQGTLRSEGTVRAIDLGLKGQVRAAGALVVDRTATIEGRVEVPSARIGVLRLTGTARIPGPLTGITFAAELRGTSEFGSITGRSVRLRSPVPTVVDKAFFRERSVSVQRIEAESVSLEGVEAAFVRAPQILLGRNCHVTTVEGTIVRQHPSSHVGPESRTPPPYGLRR